jgi:hypothetical protein
VHRDVLRVDWTASLESEPRLDPRGRGRWNPYSVDLPPLIDSTIGELLSHLEFSKIAINAHLDGAQLHERIHYGRLGKRNVMYLVTEKYIYADAYGKMHRKKREDYERAN